MAWLLGGIPRGWPGGTWAWLSSGDSTVSLSTPFASPLDGSGALRQACRDVSNAMRCDATGEMVVAAYLDEVLALWLGD
jgi:hypothetical protein